MTNTDRQLIIFGTGEMGSLARFYFERDSRYTVCGFTADDAYVSSEMFEGLRLVPFSQIQRTFPSEEFEMFVALSYRGMNRIRAEKCQQAQAAGYRLASYVCSRSVVWDAQSIGCNCFILENQTIQPGVVIGDDVMIWSGNHLGHGTSIGDHTYISSHVVIAGHATIGPRCFIGVNASIRDFATIGADTFIAMGATVTGDVKPGSVVVGSAGTVFPPESREATALKRKYFGDAAKDCHVAHSQH